MITLNYLNDLRTIVCGLLLVLLMPVLVKADGLPYYLNLNDVVEVDFRPLEAFYLINFGGDESIRARARILESDLKNYRWLIGTKISVPPGARRVSLALVIVGENEQYRFLPAKEMDVAQTKDAALSNQELAFKVDEKALELEKMTAIRRDYELSLARLRSDAEVIGEFSKVQEVKGKNDYYRQQIEGLNQDLKNLKAFLSVLSLEGTPINLSRRENELTEQLGRLALAAREAEGHERQRIQAQRAREREELEMVRLTRNQSIDEIRNELNQLIRQRREYESRLGLNSKRPEAGQ
jgi:hypothetical protein